MGFKTIALQPAILATPPYEMSSKSTNQQWLPWDWGSLGQWNCGGPCCKNNCNNITKLTAWHQNPKFRHRIHKSPSPVPILSQLDLIYTPPAILSKIHSVAGLSLLKPLLLLWWCFRRYLCRKARVFLSGNRRSPDGIFGAGACSWVWLCVVASLRGRLELIAKHSDTGFMSVETILYTHIAHFTETLL
jgi:hypothetical protein